MLRRFTYLLLGVIILIFTAGMHLKTHICGGEVVMISLDSGNKSCCSAAEQNCCKIVTDLLQIEFNYVSNEQQKQISLQDDHCTDNYLYSFYTHKLSDNKFILANRLTGPSDKANTKMVLAGLQNYRL